jgi:tetratricopeptide (TPR) repeat protein
MDFKEIKARYPVLLPLLIIAFTAVLIRVFYFLAELKNPLFLYPVIDEQEFVHTARIIAANHFTNPEHYWHPPLYSWLLAFFFKAGIELKGIVVFQFLMGITGSIILYLGLKKINSKAAFITALIWAVYPVELFTETRFLSENLYIFLSICLLYQLIRFELNIKNIIAVAIITSLLIITKSQFILFIFFFIGYLLLRKEKAWYQAVLFLAIAMILPLVVSVNNSRKANGNFMFISSNGPTNLYIGNSSDIKKTLNIRPYEWQEKFYPGLYDEAGIRFTAKDTSEESVYPYKLSKFLTQKTISDNLSLVTPLKNIFLKTFGLLHSEETPRNYDLYVYKQFNPLLNTGIWKFPFYFPLALIFYAAILFIIIRRKLLFRSKPWFWLMVLLIIHLLPSVLFFNAFRYRLPAVPVIIFLAVLFYSEYLKNLKWQLINIILIIILGTRLTSALLIQKIPEFESFTTIGKAYLKKDKPEKAEYWFRKAQRHVPEAGMVDNYENYKGAALAKEKAGDLLGALTELNKAVEKNPDLDDAYLYRASIFYKLSDFASAASDYSRAITLNRGNQKALLSAIYGRGLTRARLNDDQGALADLDSAIALFPSYTEAFTNRGIVKAKLGMFKEAVSDLDQSINLDPNDSKTYYNRAGAYAAMKNIKQALKDLDQAISISPGYAQAFYMRGKIKLSAGMDGCADLKKADAMGYALAKAELMQNCNK